MEQNGTDFISDLTLGGALRATIHRNLLCPVLAAQKVKMSTGTGETQELQNKKELLSVAATVQALASKIYLHFVKSQKESQVFL